MARPIGGANHAAVFSTSGEVGMARVRTVEEVEEIKIREKIKLSLVRQQIDLNRTIGVGGCPTARGKVYITSIFQKDGQLSITRPHLALECLIRGHLNQKDIKRRRAPSYNPRLEEPQIRDYCCCKTYKDKCPALRRFLEETDSILVKRELPASADLPAMQLQPVARETLEPVKPPKPEAAPAPIAPTSAWVHKKTPGELIYEKHKAAAAKAGPLGSHLHAGERHRR
jgi:hypothetical protein